ncbi:hypothetical protein TcCL_Unassigned00512, partial [Trypanosoma cruzi]
MTLYRHAVKRSSAECTAPSIKLNVGDMIRVEVEGVKYAQQSAPFPEELSGVFSGCDMDSDTSVVACEKYTHAVVKNWNVHLKGVSEADVVKELLGLWMELRHMMNSIQRRNVVNCTLLRGGHYNLDRTGPWFFDSPGEMVLVEDCTFLSCISGIHMVVCSGTHVCFRRCHFSSFFQHAITVEDECASFVCDNCIGEDFGGESNATGAQAEVEKKTVQKFLFSFHRGALCLTLRDECKLTLNLSTVDLRFFTCFKKTVSHLRLQRGRLEFMEKGALHGLVSRMDLDLDWTLRHRDDYATLSLSLRVGSVSIPVLLFGTMRCLRGVWNAEVPFSEASVREYPSPVKTRGFSVARWKALVRVSIIPVELCPPSGGAPLISFILDSTSVVSRRETTGEAFLEARSGIQQLSLWEFSSQPHVSLLRNRL